MYCLALPAAITLLRRVPGRRVKDCSFGAFNMFKAFCVCVFVMYALNFVSVGLITLLQDLIGSSDTNPLEQLVAVDSLPLKILVIGPITEELVFRKMLMDRMNIYGEKLAVVVSAICFGLFHGNLSQCFYAAGLGLVFGYIYNRTGRLRYSIILHMIVNFIGSILSVELAERTSDAFADMDFGEYFASFAPTSGDIAFLVYLGVLIVLGVLGLAFMIASARKLVFEGSPQEIPKGRRFNTTWVNTGMILMTLLCMAEMAAVMFVM
jgi:membrane protease YdiL (CAAX protease family)